MNEQKIEELEKRLEDLTETIKLISKKNSNLNLIPGAIIVAGLIVAFALSQGNVSLNQPKQPNQAVAPALGQKVNVALGHLPVLGDKNAKVTVIEFSDFQCPFCERYFNDAEKGIIKDYVNTGNVKFSYRHFPLTSIHPNAYKASSASECANEQGKFWEYHDLLFQNQTTWSNLDSTGAVAKFKEYAGTLGLNTGSFSSCLNSDKYKADIDKDISDGTAAGVNGTPATFVDGSMVQVNGNSVGAAPYSMFKTIIDQELSKQLRK